MCAPGERHGAGRRVDSDHAGAGPQTGVEASGQPAPDLSDAAAGGKGEGGVGTPPPGGPGCSRQGRQDLTGIGRSDALGDPGGSHLLGRHRPHLGVVRAEESLHQARSVHSLQPGGEVRVGGQLLFAPPAGEQKVVHTRLGVLGREVMEVLLECWKGQGTHRARKRM